MDEQRAVAEALSYTRSLGFGFTRMDVLGRGASWWVLSPVTRTRNVDCPFVVVSDDFTCRVEPVPVGKYFDGL